MDRSGNPEDGMSNRTGELADFLASKGLDPTKWVRILQSELGISGKDALRFIQKDEIGKLKEQANHEWEKKALTEAIKALKNEMNADRHGAMSTKVTQAKELYEAARFKLEDKTDGNLKPDFGLSQTPLESTIAKRLEGESKAVLQRSGWTAQEVLLKASGGSACCGIYVTKEEGSLLGRRRHVITVDDDLEFSGSDLAEQAVTQEFHELASVQTFLNKMEKHGKTFAVAANVDALFFQAEGSASWSRDTENESTQDTRSHTNYASAIKYLKVPIQSIYLNTTSVRLNREVLDELGRIETQLANKSQNRERIFQTFFETYGSHVCVGLVEFGGIMYGRAESIHIKSSQKESTKNLVKEAVNASFALGASVRSFSAGLKTGYSAHDLKGSLSGRYTEDELKSVSVSLTRIGGPPEVSDTEAWKKGLVEHNSTWRLIDKGSNLKAIWELILFHKDCFKDGLNLALSMQSAWVAITGIDKRPLDESKLGTEHLQEKVSKWLEEASDNDVASNLQIMSQSRMSAGISQDDWNHFIVRNRTAQEYLIRAIEVIPTSDLQSQVEIKSHIKHILEPIDQISKRNFPEIQKVREILKSEASDTIQPYVVENLEDLMNLLLRVNSEVQFADTIKKESIFQTFLKRLQLTATNLWQIKLTRSTQDKVYEYLLMTVVIQTLGYNPQTQVFCEPHKLSDIQAAIYKLTHIQERKHTNQSVSQPQWFQAFVIGQAVSTTKPSDAWSMYTFVYSTMEKHIPNGLNEHLRKTLKVYTHHTDIDKIRWHVENILKGSNRPSGDGVGPRNLETGLSQLLTHRERCTDDQQQTVICDTADRETCQLLEHLNLKEYFPQKLTLRKVLSLSMDVISCKQPANIQELPWYFLRNIMLGNSDTREMSARVPEVESNSSDAEDSDPGWDDIDEMHFSDTDNQTSSLTFEIPPLDLITAIFKCADNFLRQVLVNKMSLCQYAVPFILPNTAHGTKDVLLHWSLQNVSKEWKEGEKVHESTLTEANHPIVSFICYGEDRLKSKLLNLIISSGGQHRNYFWHQELSGGHLKSTVASGLVEVLWYLPDGEEGTKFPFPVTFANLRGNGLSHTATSKFLCEISAATCIFIEEVTADIIQEVQKLRRDNMLLVVLHSNRNATKAQLKTLSGCSPRPALLLHSLQEALQHCDVVVKDLRTTIMKKMKKTDHKSLSQVALFAKHHHGHHFVLDVGEDKYGTIQVIKELEEKGPEAKAQTLPRQGSVLKKISQLDKEQYRKKKNDSRSPELYALQLGKEKSSLRQQQLAKPLSNVLKWFLRHVSSPNPQSQKFFIRNLKLMLDSHSRKVLSPLQNQYNSIRDDGKLNDGEKKRKLADIDAALSDASLGLEHLFREFSQIYEAVFACQENQSSSSFRRSCEKLAEIVAETLIDGHPLEIMDGDASYVPIPWLKAVFQSLEKKLGDVKIFVLSVLGVQSSGKSTLLNTLFGLQFSVSSGRCTRGAYLQLIELAEDARSTYGFDFLAVIDTEGLKSPQHSSLEDAHLHDNELATFVIGISDITLVNIAMESTKEMEDTLQIAVHSFLQMNTVGEKQGCQFVHQNVAAIGAKSKNAREADKFLKDLNTMTLSAAKLAKREEAYKEFKDVLLYDPLDHTSYIDGLWQGSPPMAPINPGYSRKVQQLRQSVFNQIKLLQQVHKKKLYTLSAFTQRMTDIWEAIKCENFIFSFQNCLSIETFNDARAFLIKCMMEVKQKIREETERQKICLKGLSGRELQKQFEKSKQELELQIDKQAVELDKQLTEYSESCKYPHLLEKYLSNLQLEIPHMKKSLEAETQNSIQLCLDMQKTDVRSKELMKNGRKLVEEKVLKAATSKVMRSKSQYEIENEFEKLWNDVTGEASNLSPENNSLDIDYEMRKIIRNSPSINASIREKKLGSKKLVQYPSESFTVTKEHLDKKLILDPRKWHQYFSSHVERFSLKVKDITKSAEAHLQDIILKKNIGTDYEPCAMFENEFAESFFNFVFDKISNIRDESCTINPKFEVEFVLYLGAKAVRFFQKKHDLAIQKYHPNAQLQKLKSHYFTIFKLYQSGADVAQAFTEDFLFHEVVQNVKAHFSARNLAHLAQTKLGTKLNDHQNVQLHMMAELAEKNSFSEYKSYITQYDHATKAWIKKQCESVLLQDTDGRSFVLQQALNKLHGLLLSLTDAMKEAEERQCETRAELLRTFAQIVQQQKKVMEIKKEKLDNFIKVIEKEKQENSKERDDKDEKDRVKHFGLVVRSLLSSDKTKEKLEAEIVSWDTRKHIENTRVEDSIFKEVKSCEGTCPFCGAPCETHSGGMTTGEHEVTLHRPQGINGYRWLDSGKLIIDLCPTLVVPSANFHFKNKDTNDKWHPYKDYKTFYKTWTIRPNPNPQSLRYWKWVFAKFQTEFASFYGANSGDIPDEWKQYSWKDVKEDMEGIFNIRLSS